MDVSTNLDPSGYYRTSHNVRESSIVRDTQNARSAPVLGAARGAEGRSGAGVQAAIPKAAQAESLDYNQTYTQMVESVRELKPVNVHPKNHAAIDTFLDAAYYSSSDSIINTYV